MDRNKLILLFLLTATIVPVTLATWWFGVMSERGVGSTTNKGVLVIPVIDLTTLDLRTQQGQPAYQSFDEMTEGVSPQDYQPRPWQLLYLGGSSCDDDCVERLYFLRQLHTRLGAESDRVQRVYVHADEGASAPDAALTTLLDTEQSGMSLVFADPARLREHLARTVDAGDDPLAQHYIYLADPVGNVMLYFTPENTPEEILSDLDKLLDHSSLG